MIRQVYIVLVESKAEGSWVDSVWATQASADFVAETRRTQAGFSSHHIWVTAQQVYGPGDVR